MDDDPLRAFRDIDDRLNAYRRAFRDALDNPLSRMFQEIHDSSTAFIERINAEQKRMVELAAGPLATDEIEDTRRLPDIRPVETGYKPPPLSLPPAPRPVKTDDDAMFDRDAALAADMDRLHERMDALVKLQEAIIEDVTSLQLEFWEHAGKKIEKH